MKDIILNDQFLMAIKYISAALILLGLSGVIRGMSDFFSTWLKSIARNPEAASKLQLPGFIAFAGMELASLAIIAAGLALIF